MVEGGFVVLDFGSQLTQLIARRLREMEVFSEILPFDYPLEKIKTRRPKGIILSGGPSSISDEGAPLRDLNELNDVAPLLGICYGMQLLCSQLGGIVQASDQREYGLTEINWQGPFLDLPATQKVWMSHGDVVHVPPPESEVRALSEANHPAVIEGPNFLALQFHPEVVHTEYGTEILKYFIFDKCKAEKNWLAPNILASMLDKIREQVPENEDVLCALSGGVDSTVVGTLLTQALGSERVHCVFVDNGLLRQGEYEDVLAIYERLGLNVLGANASALFLKRLGGVDDPEKKRKIIGKTFIDVFKQAIKNLEAEGLTRPVNWLAQGTLYPDVIESVPIHGSSQVIKSHHNVGGLPKDLKLKLLEPLRELFKDEVRRIGKELKIPHEMLWRHPFPGPGLAIRIMGEVTAESLEVLRQCDVIYLEELHKQQLYEHIWQAFCVLLPVRTVGVQGDGRSYKKVLAIRAVTATDGMTADWFDFPAGILRRISNRITNEVQEVNRVVYDVTSKPPGTIEWE